MSWKLIEKQERIVQLLEMIQSTEKSKQEMKEKHKKIQSEQQSLIDSLKIQLSNQQQQQQNQQQPQQSPNKSEEALKSVLKQLEIYKKIISSYEKDLEDLVNEEKKHEKEFQEYKLHSENKEKRLNQQLNEFGMLIESMQSQINETNDLHIISNSFSQSLLNQVIHLMTSFFHLFFFFKKNK